MFLVIGAVVEVTLRALEVAAPVFAFFVSWPLLDS